ncbi:MAG TPA: M20/M25/M40 family metallo-hydrolase [Blastocatellia bacterium]|nr:M20/M25/M40 family metallo-hydrolase [Blastocatellia bacterium]
MRTLAAAVLLVSVTTLPQAGGQDYGATLRVLLERSDVKRALAFPDAERDHILAEWKSITEVHAPSGKERARAEFVRKLLEKSRLDKVYYDSKGNLIAVRKGTGGGKAVVFDAHLDTVFAEDLQIKAEVKDGKIFAPGVGDDTRNVEALLASIRALDDAGIRTKCDLIFVFTVEEETTMDGARRFIAENRDRIGQYVALDGGYEGITYAGIGISWYRHHFIGPGGHTRSRTPPYSATLPLARAIARIYSLEVPADPSSHLNIGMLGAGDAVNAKAADAWFTVDLRSTDQRTIERLERQIANIVREEAERAGMQSKTEVLSTLPASQIPGNRESFTVRMSEAVHHALGFENVSVTPTGSNNANLALLAGIPSISTGCAPCANSHALDEWCWIEPFYRGIGKVILLEIALAGIQDP